ncbi:MATE family efflux transporter, partial [Marinospirillum sp.]|uniref:MATE family efflux transporter n=1 Tax=Marinospirillum sp. TaxID=2183934 RepID=UPI003A8AABFA
MNLHTAPVGRAFWHYTLPSVAALMVSGTYQIVDGIFVGHFIGGEGLAAISLAWPLVGVLLAAGMMIGIGTGAHMSMSLGARDPDAARRYLAQSFILLLLFSLVLGSLLLTFSSAFLRAQGAEGEALAFGQVYLNWLLKGTPIVLASIALPLLVRNAGAPRLATLAMGIGAISNILLDALFIGWLGYGLEGAALATLLGELISVALCLGYLFSRRSQLPIRWRQLRWESKRAGRLLQTGFSSMLMYLYLSFSIVLHNALLLHYG